ncbi:general stress protein [Paraburkholderia azotifigens]|uniref:general stress protein n=1 Tax=Paraburkholderia azotifigens TaxID=2057004 RepID=UPI0038B7A26A
MTQETENTVLAVFTHHADADAAVKALAEHGFDMTKLSIVGKGYHSEEHAVGFYTAGDRIRTWGATGALWGGIWGLLAGPALFLVPGVGLVALAGPFVAALVSAVEGAVIGGGVTVLGAALAHIGVPKNDVVKYETVVKADGFVLIAHGTEEDIERAKTILDETRQQSPAPAQAQA